MSSKRVRARIKLRAAGAPEYRTLLIDYGATWKYKIDVHDHDSGFEAPAFNDSGWASAAAAFGHVSEGEQWGGPNGPPCHQNDSIIVTAWPVNTDLCVRKTVTIPAGTQRLYFEFGIDNIGQIYVDGDLVQTTTNEGCQTRGTQAFWVDAPPTGSIVIAIRARDPSPDTPAPYIVLNDTFFDLKLEAISTVDPGSGDADFAPATGRAPSRQIALLEDAKSIGAAEYFNDAGEFFFTLPILHPQIDAIVPFQTHWALEMHRGEGWKEIAAGLIVDYDATDEEVVFYGFDYLGILGLLIDERFNPDQSPDTAALLYPEDQAGTGGSKYVENTITEIVTDQIDRAIAGVQSPLGFMFRGSIATMDETVTIYCTLKERLSFIKGLLDSHRAGTGKRTRIRIRKDLTFVDELTYTETYSVVVEENPGDDRDNLAFEYGGLVQGFRVVPFGGFGTRVAAIGKVPMGLRLEYDIESTPVPAGEDSAYNERLYGRYTKLNFWQDISDLNDLKRRARQYAQEIGAVGKNVGLGIRVDALAVKDGWDIADSVPVIIQRGLLDTTAMGGAGMWTVWGWALVINDDGHTDAVLTLAPKDVSQDADESITDSMSLTKPPPVSVHDTDPPTDEQATSSNQIWINSVTGHIWRVDPETGLWYDATAAGEFSELGNGTSIVVFDHGNMGATETVDLDDGLWHRGTLTANCAITVTGFTADRGQVVVFEVTQDPTGGWDITWDLDITWIGDDQPDQTANATTQYLLWSSEGDSVIYGTKIGSIGFAVPDITLGTVAAEGVAETAIRSDATIVAFDDEDPLPDGTADPGVAPFAARSDHVHEAATTEADIGDLHTHVNTVLFSGDGSTTVFILPVGAIDEYAVAAYVAGVRVDITLSGTLLDVMTFGSAPASGTDNIVVDIAATLT